MEARVRELELELIRDERADLSALAIGFGNRRQSRIRERGREKRANRHTNYANASPGPIILDTDTAMSENVSTLRIASSEQSEAGAAADVAAVVSMIAVNILQSGSRQT